MDISYGIFQENLEAVRGLIASSCEKAGRNPTEVTLLPVTKNHPCDAARYAWDSGLRQVGENLVQEAIGKMDEVGPDLRWELIGPLQSNKAKRVAERFHRVQTVDRAKIALALNKHAEAAGRTLHVLLQINAGRDPAKSGAELEDADALLEATMRCESLIVDGLMTIAPLSDDENIARRCFANLRECRDRLSRTFNKPLLELSMGMSGDMEWAILEGSTIVRVGTALYGNRQY